MSIAITFTSGTKGTAMNRYIQFYNYAYKYGASPVDCRRFGQYMKAKFASVTEGICKREFLKWHMSNAIKEVS